jgi:hypothetical protein
MLISATNTALRRLSPSYRYEHSGWDEGVI